MQLIQRVPGHFRLNETSPTWLADVVMDLAMFPAGTLPVTFTADVVVGGESGDEGFFAVTTSGDPRTVGDTFPGWYVVKTGPFSGSVTGVNVDDVVMAGVEIVFHLIAISSNSDFVEISNVRITVGSA